MKKTNKQLLINSILKRIFDIFLSIILLILCMPLLIFVSLIIILDSKGSPIYVQKRVGKSNKEFYIFKLRTMFKNSSIGNYKAPSKNDKRVTSVGKFLRKSSIDELPQLLNVLIGNMSLVGPRALPKEEIKLRIENLLKVENMDNDIVEKWFMSRTKVKPGITGQAQASGRSSLTIQQATKYDYEYTLNNNIFIDMKILFKTIINVILRKGVN